MTWDELVAIARTWPEVSESMSYGEPSLKVRKALLARLREADMSVVFLDVPAEERDMLIAAAPELYFLEPHYRDHDIVLARLADLDVARAAPLLERRWRSRATRRAVATFDRRQGGGT